MNRKRKVGLQFIQHLKKQIAAQEEPGAEGIMLAPLYTQLAQLYIGQGMIPEAAEALGEVALLAEGAGELRVAAQTTQARGLLLAQEGLTPEARLVLLEAVALFAAVGDEAQTTAVAQQLTQKFPELLKDLRPYLGDDLSPEAQLNQLWAEVREAWQANEPVLAQERLNTAVSFAQTHNLLDATQLALMSHLLQLTSGQLPPELAQLLWQQSQAQASTPANLPPQVMDEAMHLAWGYLQGGAFEPAIQTARHIRFAARQTSDPFRVVRYLLASAVLAEAHNQREERVFVLAAWLTCREFLAANLGPAAAETIDQILDSLKLRWGAEEMNTAVAEYQAYVAMHGTFRA